jgi:alkane 1-monooxygenase
MELLGAVLSMGVACGVLGINVAHDLGHRRKTYEQNLAKSLLLTSLYMHFFIEHNRGHHARVATHADPATSRRGESIFQFLPRSIAGGWLDAWELEFRRLKVRKLSLFSLRNQMMRFQLLQVAFTACIFLAFGPTAGIAFVAAALMGAVMLETVNYVEHYGLRREEKPNGRFEGVRPAHSWNSNHPVGRIILFELTRHSDHHANDRRRYQVLRHFDESPQLPTGYPAMMVLAWCPPLWFAVMHRELDRYGTGEESGTPSAELASA